MLYISDFADQAVMMPLVTVVALALAVIGWWRGLAAWLVAIVGVFGLMLALKAGLVSLSENFGSDYTMSPSGHVAAGCVVYGALAVLLLKSRVPAVLIAVVPLLAILIIGYSRVQLGAHSLGEVVAGAIVGCTGVVAFAFASGPRPKLMIWPVAVAGSITILALHGLHMPAEEAIRSASSGW